MMHATALRRPFAPRGSDPQRPDEEGEDCGREHRRHKVKKTGTVSHEAHIEAAGHSRELVVLLLLQAHHAWPSAMPQIGQEPGALRTISGCIGQTYSVPPD